MEDLYDNDQDFSFLTLVLFSEVLNNEENAIALYSTTSKKYVLDSGANTHLFQDPTHFSNIEPYDSRVTTANAGSFARTTGRASSGFLKNVLFSPEATFNLISVSRLADEGLDISFGPNAATIRSPDGTVLCYGAKVDGLYLITEEDLCLLTQDNTSLPNLPTDNELFNLHRKMAHSSMVTLKKAVDENIIVINDKALRDKILNSPIVHCPICYMAKPRRTPINHTPTEQHEVLSKFGMDWKGIFPASTINGYTSCFIFTDYASHFVFIYPTKTSLGSDAAKAFLACVAKVNSLGFCLKFLQTDDDPRFRSAEFRSCLLNTGVTHHVSVPDTPWMNGRVERSIGTLFGLTRSLLIDSGAPIQFWPEALQHAVFLWNHTPRSNGDNAPLALLRNVLLDATKLVNFFARGKCMRRTQQIGHSFSSRTMDCRFLGYFNGMPDLFVVYTDEGQAFVTRDAAFDLNLELCSKDISLPPDYDGRSYNTDSLSNFAAFSAHFKKVPRSINEALSSPDHLFWLEALQKERDNFILYKTFEDPGEVPPGVPILNSLLVFTVTTDNSGKIKYKVRLVARGDQQEIADKDSLFAPTTPSEINKLLLAIAAARGLVAEIFDVAAAFLEGRNDRIEYVRVPRFFSLPFTDVGNVVKIAGNFYGCRQAPRIWAEKLKSILTSIGCKRSAWVPTLFLFREGDNQVIISVHVDDGLMTSSCPLLLQKFKNLISSKVNQIKFTPNFQKFLGMEIEKSDTGLKLSHKNYLLNHFPHHLPAKLPSLVPDSFLDIRSEEAKSEDFLHMAGTLRFAVDRARPDLIGFTNEISTGHYKNPIELLNQVIGYALATPQYQLCFRNSSSFFLHGFTDSSLIKRGDGKSRIGGCFFLNSCSGSFHAYSTKISSSSLVSVSSCEAELKGIYECCTRGLYFREILIELGVLPNNTPCIIFTDNAPAISIIKKGSSQSNIRLLSNRIIALQEYISDGLIKIVHIEGELNVSDLLTKGNLTKKRFDQLSRVLLEGYQAFPDLARFIGSL